jgi:hypothetical protein
MYATKYLVPAFAVLGLAAAAQSTSICSQATATISSQADATALASSCSTYSGSIAIASSVAGSIDISGIQQITGDLICLGAVNLTSLSGSTLSAIGGSMTLTSLTIMSTLNFPSLTSVSALTWTTLNALQQLSFGTTGITKAATVFITDTALTTLAGINLMTVGSMEITNNAYLRTISTNVANITQSLIISANGPNLNLTFPALTFAYNMTVRNVSSLMIPALSAINTTFGVYGSSMTSVMAPNLTTVGTDLVFVADASLTNISMPALKTVGGGVLIANNTGLLSIDGFPLLSSAASISLSGNFTNATLPSLTDVKGTFNAQSSGNFSCTPFQADKNNQVIKGTFTCKAATNDVQASGTGGVSTGTATAGTSSAASATATKSAANLAQANAPVVMGAFAFIAGVAQFAL